MWTLYCRWSSCFYSRSLRLSMWPLVKPYHDMMILYLGPWPLDTSLDHAPLRAPLVPEVRIIAGWSRAFFGATQRERNRLRSWFDGVFCCKGYAARSGQCTATTSQTQWGIQSTYPVFVWKRWKKNNHNFKSKRQILSRQLLRGDSGDAYDVPERWES